MENRISNGFKWALKQVLPNDRTFWSFYSPIIGVLKDSKEHRLIREKLALGLNLSARDILLDAGCGVGDFVRESAPKVARVVGIDLEPRMLEAARAKVGLDPRIDLVRADLNGRLPFGDGSFTKITNILVLSYLRDRHNTVSELVRLLSPGGRIGIVTPAEGANFFKILKAEVSARRDERSIVSNLKKLPLGVAAVAFGKITELKDRAGQWHFYSAQELAEELRAEGLTVLEMSRVYADQAILVIAQKPF